MRTTLTYTGTLVTDQCWCGIHHAIPQDLKRQQERQHRDGDRQTAIYCPLGHEYIISGKGRVSELEERLVAERDRAARLAAERDQVAASLRAQKAATTRAKKRHVAGVCPHCQRSFKQLREHMKRKHPEALAEHGVGGAA